jgi:DNA-directed RNA polymerase specialized sigma24 family protein
MNVRRATGRDLEALYQRRYRDFVRVASAITESGSDGIEVVQAAFAQALGSISTYRGEASLEAWVWRIVVNEARAQRRSPKAESLGGTEPLAPNGHPFDEHGVRAWIAALPERQRLAVFLRYYADPAIPSVIAGASQPGEQADDTLLCGEPGHGRLRQRPGASPSL